MLCYTIIDDHAMDQPIIYPLFTPAVLYYIFFVAM